jgi:hypothetical protein
MDRVRLSRIGLLVGQLAPGLDAQAIDIPGLACAPANP